MPFLGAGTFASYQGLPCAAVRFVRARGPGSSTSTVVIPLGAFGPEFRMVAMAQGQLEQPARAEAPSDFGGAFSPSPIPLGALPQELQGEGTLVLAEDPGFALPIPGLVVRRAETEQGDDTGGVVFVKLTLGDSRLFRSRGVVGRWRFNAQRKDGTQDVSTLRPDGSLWTLKQILEEEVVPHLWRRPELSDSPAEWGEVRQTVEWEPWAKSGEALSRLLEQGGGADPCLRLDNTVAVHLKGEGRLGYAPGGVGPNSQEIPPDYFKDKDGKGTRWAIEQAWPDEFLLFVGPPRVATVALDVWEPVLLIDGVPYLLSEELVRLLTDGKRGLEWLQKWVLLPSSDQGLVEGLDDRVAKVLGDQAYRLFRLPGAELVGGGQGGAAGQADPGAEEADPEEGLLGAAQRAALEAASAAGQRGFYTGTPGPNAHLLPLLDRAETAAGRRLPVTVEAWGFEQKRRKFEATESGAALIELQRRRLEIKRAMLTILGGTVSSRRNPFSYGNPPVIDSDSELIRQLGGGVVRGLDLVTMNGGEELPPGIDRERAEYYLKELRRVELLREVSPEVAQRWERTLAEEAKAKAAQGGADEASLGLAKALSGFENTASKEFVAEDVGDGQTRAEALSEKFQRQFGDQAKGAIRKASRDSLNKRRATRAREEVGLGAAKIQGPVFVQNKRRALDGAARVVSRELGIIRTGGLAGIVREPGVHDVIQTSLQPMPVRVTFGATLRPRVDTPQGGRVPTGTAAASPAALQALLLGSALPEPANAVPQVLSDQETPYQSAWRRTVRGQVEPVTLEQLPLHRATRVEVRWRELVPLTGLGNKAALDEQARQVALDLAKRPDDVRGRSVELTGPWPVQCDGLVSRVEIVLEFKEGVPCGFSTIVTVGAASVVPAQARTRERGR